MRNGDRPPPLLLLIDVTIDVRWRAWRKQQMHNWHRRSQGNVRAYDVTIHESITLVLSIKANWFRCSKSDIICLARKRLHADALYKIGPVCQDYHNSNNIYCMWFCLMFQDKRAIKCGRYKNQENVIKWDYTSIIACCGNTFVWRLSTCALLSKNSFLYSFNIKSNQPGKSTILFCQYLKHN